MKIISLIGYSGSGKTYFITRAIQLLKSEFNYNIACIKNVHQHPIDKRGKDSNLYTEAGATFSIIKNKFNEHALFIKKELEINTIIKWLENAPIKIDLIFIESFRNLNYPSILCIKDNEEISPQLTSNVRMISGIIKPDTFNYKTDIPLIDIELDFQKFLKIFEIG